MRWLLPKRIVVRLVLAGGVATAATPSGRPHPPPGYASSGDQALYKINIDGSSRVQLLAQTRVLDLSADRTKALLVRSASDGLFRILVVHSLATGAEAELVTMQYEIENASWSPDGHRIAFDVTNTSQCIPSATR